MTGELKITLSFDKLRFKRTLFKWTAERDCSTCEYEEQKKWENGLIPVCNICEPEKEYWRLRETLFDKLVSDCTNVITED